MKWRRVLRGAPPLLFLLHALSVTALPGEAGRSLLPEQRSRLTEEALPHARELAALPEVVSAVREANSGRISERHRGMTNERWKLLAVSSREVQGLAEAGIAHIFRARKKRFVSELFVSDRTGKKVALLEKTTRWSHEGQPKHEDPMQGKVWYGELELDESSGIHQVQIAVPVTDGGKPIGSLVMGVAMSKLGHGN
jgi:hypothetical protein